MHLFPQNHWSWAWLKGLSSWTAADFAYQLLEFSLGIPLNAKLKFLGHYIPASSAICSLPVIVISYSGAGELAVRKQVVFSDNLGGKQILAKVKRETFPVSPLPDLLGAVALFRAGACILLKPTTLLKRQLSSASDLQMKKEPVREKTELEMFSIHGAPRIQSS